MSYARKRLMVGPPPAAVAVPPAGAGSVALGGVLIQLGAAAAAGFALLLLFGLVASVLAVGFMLSAPARTVVGAPPADLPGAVESVLIPSPSGSVLRGWHVEPPRARGAVVLLHGAWSNRASMLRRAWLFAGQGFAVLLLDLQAHGKARGAGSPSANWRRWTHGLRSTLCGSATPASRPVWSAFRSAGPPLCSGPGRCARTRWRWSPFTPT